MTRRRWIADEYTSDRAALLGSHAAHLSRTLRARVGQDFEVACGDRVRHATVSSVADDRVEFALGEEVSVGAALPITLLLAVFKFDRMEWAIEKCTELNVTTIVPVIARRTEKHVALTAEKRVERWRRIAREASEQSRRLAPPEIREPMRLKDALAFDNWDSQLLDSAPNRQPRGAEPHRPGIAVSPGREPWVSVPTGPSPVGTTQTARDAVEIDTGVPPRASQASAHLRVVLAETEREAALIEVLNSHPVIESLTLAIGPEGGWTPEELHSFATSQWIAASLGDTILRAETAAIAALAIARAEV